MANGALTGAGTGATIGTAIYPGIGTAIGAGVGLLGGALMDRNSQNAQHQAIQNAVGELGNAQGYIDSAYGQNLGLAQQGINSANGIWDPNGNVSQKYQDALSGLEGVNGYEADLFSYDKSIKDFYDPAFQLSVNMANDSINNSQAFGGNMFSSDTANKLAAKNNVLATQMYNDARDAMNADKGLEQSIWAGNESAKQAEAANAANLANAKIGAYGNAMSNISQANSDYIKSLMDLNSGYASDMTDYYGTLASLKANDKGKKSWYESILDPLGIFG